MAGENLTAIQYAINDLRLEQTPIPEIGDDDVLIEIKVVGICGSDIHYLTKGRIGPFVLTKPMICGHEASGQIVKCGSKVKNLKVGDRVAIDPHISCKVCEFCKTGRYNLCTDLFFCATPPDDGNLRRFYPHKADFCYKLPDNMDYNDGALIEPLAVGVHACKRAKVFVGANVVIFGPGPIGIVTMSAARAMGASKVLVVGKDFGSSIFRLSKIEEMGADYVLHMKENDNEEEFAKKIKKTMGVEPDITFDCCGSGKAVRIAMLVTKNGGVVVLIAVDETDANVPLGSALFREVDIRGIFRYVNDYPMAIDMVSTGKINLKPMITHHFAMKDTLEAFATCEDKANRNAIKVHIELDPNWKPENTPIVSAAGAATAAGGALGVAGIGVPKHVCAAKCT